MTLSPKRAKTERTPRLNILRSETKITNILPTCFKIVSLHFALLLKPSDRNKNFLQDRTALCPTLHSPLGKYSRKTPTLVKHQKYFIPAKFHQIQSSASGEDFNLDRLTNI